MSSALTDTTGWRVVVPLVKPLDLAGSRLRATLTDKYGGALLTLDSTVEVPGYDGAREIEWTADANGLANRLMLTVTRAMRGAWLAVGSDGRPGLATLFADVLRDIAGSPRDPEFLGRTGFVVAPGTDSPAVANFLGSYAPVLSAIQGVQSIAAAALATGAQGAPGRDGGSVLTLRAVEAISGHRVARGASGGVVPCSVDVLDDADTAIGITENAARPGGDVAVRYGGTMTDTTWAWVEGPVFAGPDGLLTQTPPRAAFEQRVGTAINPTQIVVEIEPSFIFAA